MPALTMYRGDDQTFDVTITADGEAVDLGGMTITFTARRALDDEEPVSVLTLGDGISMTDADAGQCSVTIPADATSALTSDARLVWDLEITDDQGRKRTVAAGTLLVRGDVSRDDAS